MRVCARPYGKCIRVCARPYGKCIRVCARAAAGELTLRGAVLPVGGVKDKLLAAHRAGVAFAIVPARNRGGRRAGGACGGWSCACARRSLDDDARPPPPDRGVCARGVKVFARANTRHHVHHVMMRSGRGRASRGRARLAAGLLCLGGARPRRGVLRRVAVAAVAVDPPSLPPPPPCPRARAQMRDVLRHAFESPVYEETAAAGPTSRL